MVFLLFAYIAYYLDINNFQPVKVSKRQTFSFKNSYEVVFPFVINASQLCSVVSRQSINELFFENKCIFEYF